MQKITCWIFISLCTLACIGCTFSRPDSFIIIAVPHLGVSQVNCNQDDISSENSSGLASLCLESVRFTHTYTTSTLAAPSIASLLTGKYPIDHQLQTNKSYLNANFETLAETALKNGFATSFLSGGLPIVRKTGLNQGFEVFDDNFNLTKNSLFRNFKQSIQLFKDWQTKEANHKPFLTFFFAPDLQFTNTLTISTNGEERNLTYESQFEEFDYQLSQLIQFLKKQNIWQSTHIILIGTSGNQINRPDEPIKAINLNSENTQVAFLWKPSSTKKRDLEQNWKIDANISLADIGLTLKNLIIKDKADAELKIRENETFPVVSFANNLKETQVKFNQDRPLLIESSWPVQNQFGQSRFAVVSGKFLYINDQTPQIYNTLIDRLELYPIVKMNQMNNQLQIIQNALTAKNIQPWTGIPQQFYHLFSLTFDEWTRKDFANQLSEKLLKLSQRLKQNKFIEEWLLQNTLENKKWPLLLELAKKQKNPFALVVAESNIQHTINLHLQNPCFQILYYKKINHEDLKTCTDSKMNDFIRYYRAQELGLNIESEKIRFKKMWMNHLNEKDILKVNLGLGLLWDLDPRIEYAPETIDYVLLMPQFNQLLVN